MNRQIKMILTIIIIISFNFCFSQNLSDKFEITIVNTQINEFVDTFDLSTPLKSFVTFEYSVLINGKNDLQRELSSTRIKHEYPENIKNSKVSSEVKNIYLNDLICEVIIYKKSVAFVISKLSDNDYSIRVLINENGMWLNDGEDPKTSYDDCIEHINKYAEYQFNKYLKTKECCPIPTDTLEFYDFIKFNGVEPQGFVMNKLKEYKLVMYGDIHNRKISWDFLTSIVKNENFPEYAGTIFMEMASNKQNEIDLFLGKDTIDKDLLLDVFRDYMLVGWSDKGMFDFIVSIWQLNKKLPDNKKIKIIAVDTPRIFTEEGLKNEIIDRDSFMANSILKYLSDQTDKRNTLFIVGTSHVCKTLNSAGSILSARLKDSVYTIFTHSPRVDEYSITKQKIRHGVFDCVFNLNGNIPVAFDLNKNPFGKEPFDGLYFEGSGTFQDNYDGYIFFGKLEEEPNGEILFEMYNDDFIIEIDRRYKLIGRDFKTQWGLNELNVEDVKQALSSGCTKTRWEEYFKE